MELETQYYFTTPYKSCTCSTLDTKDNLIRVRSYVDVEYTKKSWMISLWIGIMGRCHAHHWTWEKCVYLVLHWDRKDLWAPFKLKNTVWLSWSLHLTSVLCVTSCERRGDTETDNAPFQDIFSPLLGWQFSLVFAILTRPRSSINAVSQPGFFPPPSSHALERKCRATHCAENVNSNISWWKNVWNTHRLHDPSITGLCDWSHKPVYPTDHDESVLH